MSRRRSTYGTVQEFGAIPNPYVEIDAANYVSGLSMPNSGTKGGSLAFNNSPVINSGFGKCFDLSNYFAQIAATLPTEFSVEFWLKNTNTTRKQIFETIYVTAGAFGTRNPKLAHFFDQNDIIDYTDSSKMSSAISLTGNQWNHFVFSYSKNEDGSYTDNVYINSILSYTRTVLFSAGYDGYWNIFTGYWGYITGLCTIFRIYNSAINQASINSLYTTQKSRHGL